MRILRSTLFILLLLLGGSSALRAQFYYNGRGPMNIRWTQLKTSDYKLVYPDYFAPTAAKLAGFMDSMVNHITFGFTRPPQRLPLLLHTENLYSNGEVVWAPKRSELFTSAPAEGDVYADPWLQQLVVHEYRHIVQLSALRGGLTKALSFVFGQAGTAVGMLVTPKWFMEGDATMAETQFSEFGRALQPRFTVGMRAILADDSLAVNRTTDRWICGSFRTFTPDIYSYGYHLVSAGERYCEPGVWGKAVEYAGKYPILITPVRHYLRRNYNTTPGRLSRQALTDLYQHWKPFSAVADDYTTLTRPERSYTTYVNPLPVSGGRTLAVKNDYDQPNRMVEIDSAGGERRLFQMPTPSSRPVLRGDKLYWTEYKPHPVWQYKNYSIVREHDLKTGARKSYGRGGAHYFVTPLDGGRFVTVSPDSLGGSDLILRDSRFREIDRMRFDGLTSLHGVAWDSTTNTVAFIALDLRGMWLGAVTPEVGGLSVLRELTAPSKVTVSGLTASDGRLWFSSIASGKDEIHSFDLRTLREYRQTASRFGAYAPSVRDSVLRFTTYTKEGTMIATASTDTAGKPDVEWSRLPENLLNLPTPSWGVPTISELPMTDSVAAGGNLPNRKVKRYNKALRWFNVHSWVPLALDVDKLLDDRELNLGLGISLFFQSAMGDSYGAATYGRLNAHDWLFGSFTYAGLPVQITLDAEYGGGKQSVVIPVNDQHDGVVRPDHLKNYFRTTGTFSVPLNFSGGNNYRLLQPSFSISHYNALLYNAAEQKFDHGYQKYNASLWWSNSRQASIRCVTPRLGYAVSMTVSGALSGRFGTVYSLYGRGYLPGVMRNHSMMLRTGFMYQSDAEFGFSSKPLFPRGVSNRYAAKRYFGASFDYTFPAFYPDGGINTIVYFKRIWFNLFGDYGTGDYFAPDHTTRVRNYSSYGGDVGFDVNLFASTMPIGLKFTFASPSDTKFYFGFGLSFSF